MFDRHGNAEEIVGKDENSANDKICDDFKEDCPFSTAPS